MNPKILSASVLVAILAGSGLPLLNALEAPTILTDKPDYAPDSDVFIYGANFLTSQVTVSVTRPDNEVNSWTVDVASNRFSTVYTLDGIMGLYRVTAIDPSTGITLAETTFTDGPPKKYGTPAITFSSSFTSSAPALDGRLAPFVAGGPPFDGGSTPWPFTAPNEWSDAAKFGMFSFDGGAIEPPWTTLKNEMFFPKTDEWGKLTIVGSGPPSPTSPPWAPSWLFIMNDATYLYLLVEINPANKVCFECPDGTGPSDKAIFYLDTNLDASVDKTYSWAYGKVPSPEVIAISCTIPYPAGDCPSPTVYEARIPLSALGCTALPCMVGLWVDSHASPHGSVAPPPPPPPSSVPEFDSPMIAVLLGTISIAGMQFVRKRRS